MEKTQANHAKRSSACSSSVSGQIIPTGAISASKSSIMMQNLTSQNPVSAARQRQYNQRKSNLQQRAATAKNRRSGLATPQSGDLPGQSRVGADNHDIDCPPDDYCEQNQNNDRVGRNTSRTGIQLGASQQHYTTIAQAGQARSGSGLSNSVGMTPIAGQSQLKGGLIQSIMTATAGQRSGKAFFGRASLTGGAGPLNINTKTAAELTSNADQRDRQQLPPSLSSDSENRRDRKKLEDLIDSVWPKDPLREREIEQSTMHLGEFLDAGTSSQFQTHKQLFGVMSAKSNQRQQFSFARHGDSEIKSNLNRIKEAELQLGDMISRHIKKRGPDKFQNSSFVVTSKSAYGPHQPVDYHSKAARKAPDSQQKSKGEASHQRNTLAARLERKKMLDSNISGAALDVAQKLKNIMDLGRNDGLEGNNKMHKLECFRPREIFNINTHALFQPDKQKDPFDSDDNSDNNEEEIISLLRTQKGEVTKPIGVSGHDTSKSAKIDLKAYRPDKSIDYNIKVMRAMINKAKVATNTTRSASLAQGRKEQLKMSKFIKKDSSHLQQSKIAKETSEAIQFMNKRQPLTVQNSKGIDDSQLFSLPGKRKRNTSPEKTDVNQSKSRSNSRSQSPSKQINNLQLTHFGQKAKFYRNVSNFQQSSHQTQPSFAFQDDGNMMGSGTIESHKRGNSLKTTSVTNFNPSQAAKTQQMPTFTPIRPSQSANRQAFFHNKNLSQANYRLNHRSRDEFSRGSIGLNSDQIQVRLRLNQNATGSASRGIQAKRESLTSGIQAGASEVEQINVRDFEAQDSSNFVNIHQQNPVIMNNPHIVNNIQLSSSDQLYPKQRKDHAGQKRKQSRSRKRGATQPKRSKAFTQTKKLLASQPSVASQNTRMNQQRTRMQQSRLSNVSSQLNFHPATPLDGGRLTPSRFTRQKKRASVDDPMLNDEPSMGHNFMPIAEARASEFTSYKTSQNVEMPSVLFNMSSEGGVNINYNSSSGALLNRKRSSAVVKVDRTLSEKEHVLNPFQMMRILDARNADMGLKSQVNTDLCTPEELECLINEFERGVQGPQQRFKDYCDQKCVNRRLVLQGFSLGPLAAREIAEILATNPDIVHVDLSKNNLQDEGVEWLISVLKQNDSIIHLDLTQNNITAKGSKKLFKALSQNISLISLKIGNIENVSKNKVGVKAVPKLNKFIRTSQVLSFLDLRSTNLTDAGLSLLSDGMKGNRTIEILSLSKNDITSSGIEKFSPILCRTAIRDLDLSLNPLGNNGVRNLAENLFERVPDERRPGSLRKGEKCNIVKLNLAETKFQKEGGFKLFENLIQFHKIEVLILDYNQFESSSSQKNALRDFIEKTRIDTLSLNYCKLGDSGGVAIGEALQASSSRLRDLRAKKNEFRDKTARAIAQAIEVNSQMQKLDLSSNLINDSGGELLGLAIGGNETLTYLNLKKNNLRATSGAMFAQSMKENKTLKCLKLEKNSININFIEQIEKYVQRNSQYFIENSVIALRENREEYLSKREYAWNEVYKLQESYKVQIEELERDIKLNEGLLEHLTSQIHGEGNLLHVDLKRNLEWKEEKCAEFDRLKAKLVNLEKNFETEKETKTYQIQQTKRLTEMCREVTSQKKSTIKQVEAQTDQKLYAMDIDLANAERQLKKAEKEMLKVKEELDNLKGVPQSQRSNTTV